MKTIGRRNSYAASALALAAVMLLAPLATLGQTRIEMPKNKYSVSDDVRLGQQAAQQVYTDAGGMVRLNIEDLNTPPATSNLLGRGQD